MKNKILSLFLILSLSVSVLTGCGSKETPVNEQSVKNEIENSSEAVTVQDNVSSIESKEEVASDSKMNLNLFSEIKPVSEEEVVINLGDVDIKLAQTWEEFKNFIDTNGWTMDEEDYPTLGGRYGGGYVYTPYGKIDVSFMKNPDETGFEVEGFSFSFTDIKAEDLNIHGITMKTTPDQLKEVLEHLPDISGPGYDSFILGENLQITLMNTLDDPTEYHIYISRTPYFKRTK